MCNNFADNVFFTILAQLLQKMCTRRALHIITIKILPVICEGKGSLAKGMTL